MKLNLNARSAGLSTAGKLRILTLVAALGCTLGAQAQFSSGSNGSDGAFDLTGTVSGTTVTFAPASFSGNQHNLGIYNFTKITIPSGVTVRLSSLQNPGPVYWLASSDVDIEGTVDLSGRAGYGQSLTLSGRLRQFDAGAGGYPGGVGSDGVVSSSGGSGDGPGGGSGSTNQYGNNGTNTGNSFLVPLVGGSGGGGGWNPANQTPLYFGYGGGSGGGALLIASSTMITVNGTINAQGGSGGYYYYYGAGAGGSVRLVTNTFAGNGSIQTTNPQYGNYAPGIVRLESFNSSATFTVTGSESSDTPSGSLVLPTVSHQGTVTIASINNVAAPAVPTASIAAPDVTIDSGSQVKVTVSAANIPVGTIVTLHLYSDNNSTDQTVQTSPLAGTLASSTANAYLTFPAGYSLNYVKATWTSATY